jgi:hypothetical protein
MSSSGNRRLARLYYQNIMNKARLDYIPKVISEDFTFTIPTHPEVFRGVSGFQKEVTGLHGAFPDVHLNVHHTWCFDDLIIGLWRGTGTHNGSEPLSTPAGPLPATGRRFSIEGVSWIYADGRFMRENLANEDTLKIVHDLGVKDSSALYRSAEASLVSSFQFPQSSPISFLHDLPVTDSVVLDHPLLLQKSESRSHAVSFLSSYWTAFDHVDLQITHAKRSPEIIAYRWTFQADHVRSFFGIPASNRRITHQGVTICILNHLGQVSTCYINENLIVLLGQMQSAS